MNPIEINKIPITGRKIDETVHFDEEMYKKAGILELKDLKLKGKIEKNRNQDVFIKAILTGIMILPDAVTLEPIPLPLEIRIEERIDEGNETIQEYFEKNKNILDIMGILWENIVLEVPISISKGNRIDAFGSGWELVRNTKESMDPRLAPLRKLLDSEKE